MLSSEHFGSVYLSILEFESPLTCAELIPVQGDTTRQLCQTFWRKYIVDGRLLIGGTNFSFALCLVLSFQGKLVVFCCLHGKSAVTDALMHCYNLSESCGKLTPKAFSILEAGPARPCWREYDSRRFLTRLRSTSTGLKHSSPPSFDSSTFVDSLLSSRDSDLGELSTSEGCFGSYIQLSNSRHYNSCLF